MTGWRVMLLSPLDGADEVDVAGLTIRLNEWTPVPRGNRQAFFEVQFGPAYDDHFRVERWTGAAWKPVMPKHPEVAAKEYERRLAAGLASVPDGSAEAPPASKRRPGRPRLEDDPVARELYERAEKIRLDTPGITLRDVAAQVNMSPDYLKELRRRLR